MYIGVIKLAELIKEAACGQCHLGDLRLMYGQRQIVEFQKAGYVHENLERHVKSVFTPKLVRLAEIVIKEELV